MIHIDCLACGHKNGFDQPYPYHAGFGDQGFLYNDDGNLTLIWSAFDPAYTSVVGGWNPWALTLEQQARFEEALPLAPSGGSWRFSNPARCEKCKGPISDPMARTIYYLVYPGSVNAELGPAGRHLQQYLDQ